MWNFGIVRPQKILEIWNFGNLEFWNFGILELLGPKNLEIWNFGNLSALKILEF